MKNRKKQRENRKLKHQGKLPDTKNHPVNTEMENKKSKTSANDGVQVKVEGMSKSKKVDDLTITANLGKRKAKVNVTGDVTIGKIVDSLVSQLKKPA
jgi:FKBP-type peptidyl-prolyl cis-trans isomerase